MGPNSEDAFPEDTLLKRYNQQKEKKWKREKKRKKIMFGSENRGETLFFMFTTF